MDTADIPHLAALWSFLVNRQNVLGDEGIAKEVEAEIAALLAKMQ